MKRNSLLLAAVALAFTGCATVVTPRTTPTLAAASQVTPGVSTRGDVDQLLGTPRYNFAATTRAPAQATYDYHDAFGQDTELTVTYDAKGIVQSKFSTPQENH